MVALAISILNPFMLPLASSRMTTSLGDVAAWMYLAGNEKWRQFWRAWSTVISEYNLSHEKQRKLQGLRSYIIT
jgi:hypothetical protein